MDASPELRIRAKHSLSFAKSRGAPLDDCCRSATTSSASLAQPVQLVHTRQPARANASGEWMSQAQKATTEPQESSASPRPLLGPWNPVRHRCRPQTWLPAACTTDNRSAMKPRREDRLCCRQKRPNGTTNPAQPPQPTDALARGITMTVGRASRAEKLESCGREKLHPARNPASNLHISDCALVPAQNTIIACPCPQ